VGIHTALVAGLAKPLQKGLYSLCFAVAPVAPCVMGDYAQRVCVNLRARRDFCRLRGCIQGLGGRGPKARGPLRCCRRVYARSIYLSARMPGFCVSARLWACANRKGGTRRRPQSERESTAGPPVCQRERRARAQPRSRARQACMHALMSSRQAHALTPKISTTRMKTGTNTLTDTSSPAIPPIALATRRQTESTASAELRNTCEHSGLSGPAGVRSSPAAHPIDFAAGATTIVAPLSAPCFLRCAVPVTRCLPLRR
jgi:hypothetical protein